MSITLPPSPLRSGDVRLDRAWIESHIPHRGRMCLLQEVLSWDGTRICCRATSHRDADNPLRAHGRLGSACAVEYAAQAMAVHGALLAAAPATARAGLLASVRSLLLSVTRIDDLEADLIARAERLTSDERGALYGFTVESDGRELLRGRAGIVFGVTPT